MGMAPNFFGGGLHLLVWLGLLASLKAHMINWTAHTTTWWCENGLGDKDWLGCYCSRCVWALIWTWSRNEAWGWWWVDEETSNVYYIKCIGQLGSRTCPMLSLFVKRRRVCINTQSTLDKCYTYKRQLIRFVNKIVLPSYC